MSAGGSWEGAGGSSFQMQQAEMPTAEQSAIVVSDISGV